MSGIALSFILCARNDAYRGNSAWRLETALNSLGELVAARDRTAAVEVLVSDWGSDLPLRDVVRLEAPARAIVRFVTVPPDVARTRQRDSPFPEVLALNAAARRARGRFIGRIDQDTIVGDRFLTWFFREAVGPDARADAAETLWFSGRRGIPYRLASRSPERQVIARFVRTFGTRLPVLRGNRWFEDRFWSGSVGIWLAARACWEACRGYDERLIYYNWMETDMIRRLGRRYPIVDLGRMTREDFYHLDHHDPRSAVAARAGDRKNADLNPSAPAPPLAVNDEAWGLADVPLPVEASRAEIAAPPARRPAAREALAFTGAMARLAADLAVDRVVVAARRASHVGQRRARTATAQLSERPVALWPGTLWRLWQTRKAGRAR